MIREVPWPTVMDYIDKWIENDTNALCQSGLGVERTEYLRGRLNAWKDIKHLPKKIENEENGGQDAEAS